MDREDVHCKKGHTDTEQKNAGEEGKGCYGRQFVKGHTGRHVGQGKIKKKGKHSGAGMAKGDRARDQRPNEPQHEDTHTMGPCGGMSGARDPAAAAITPVRKAQ